MFFKTQSATERLLQQFGVEHQPVQSVLSKSRAGSVANLKVPKEKKKKAEPEAPKEEEEETPWGDQVDAVINDEYKAEDGNLNDLEAAVEEMEGGATLRNDELSVSKAAEFGLTQDKLIIPTNFEPSIFEQEK